MSPRRILFHGIAAAVLLMAPFSTAQTNPGKNPGIARPTKRSAPESQQMRTPIFVSGQVVVDDGTPPPERVAIERVCNGQARREAYTDSHGGFSFQLGGDTQMMQDASVGVFDGLRSPMSAGGAGGGGLTPALTPSAQTAGVTQRDLMSCELRASLAGFVSEPVSLAGRQIFDNPNIGTLVLHRMGKVEGTKISITTMQAPAEAKKAFERARQAIAKNDRKEAAKDLEKAVALYPKFTEALSQLGEIYVQQERLDDASRLLKQAVEADPKFVPAYVNLALLAGEQRDWTRMAESSEKALALNPYEYPAAYFYSAIANYNLHNLQLAEKNARMARRLDSQYHMPRIDFLLANVLVRREDYAGAAEHFRSFLKYQPTGEEAESARTLLALTEQRIASAPAAAPKQ